MTNIYEVRNANTGAALGYWSTTEDSPDGDVAMWEFHKNEGATGSWCADKLLDTGTLVVTDTERWEQVLALAVLAHGCLCSRVTLRHVGTQQ